MADLGFHPFTSHANFVSVKVGDAKEFVRRLEAEGVVVLPWDAVGDADSIRVAVGTPAQVTATVEAIRTSMLVAG